MNTLIDTAKQMMKKAYAPYSDFTVGAALLCADGSIYTGCNIENSSFTPTVCAERVAFFKALSEGKNDFVRIAVAGGKNGVLNDATHPCGVCLQVISEFCSPDFEIILVKDNGFTKYTLKDLLPHGFKF